MGCSSWGRKESGTTEQLTLTYLHLSQDYRTCIMTGNDHVHGLQQAERTIKQKQWKNDVFIFVVAALLPGIFIQAFMAFQWFGVITFFLHYWFYNEHFAILQILPSIMYCFHQFYLFYAKHRVLSVIYLHLSSNSPFLFSFPCQLPITNLQLPKGRNHPYLFHFKYEPIACWLQHSQWTLPLHFWAVLMILFTLLPFYLIIFENILLLES